MKKIILEMVPVVAGILIALFINQWKENHNNRIYIRRAFDSIQREMQDNMNALAEVIPKHQALLQSLRARDASNRQTIGEILLHANGLQSATLKSTAWKFFVDSKTELIDYEIISQLSAIEESKIGLDAKIDKLMDLLYQKIDASDTGSIRMLIFGIANMMDSEEQLMRQYKDYLAKNATHHASD